MAPSGTSIPNAGSATIANKTLVITGSNGPDAVTLSADATQAQVAFGDDPATTFHFNLTDFNAISVSLGNGDDQFTEAPGALTDKPLTIDGGNGNDTIKTGDGNERSSAATGRPIVPAGGNGYRVARQRRRRLRVAPAGQHTVDGGNANSDVMRFVEANVNETMASGQRVGGYAASRRHRHGPEHIRGLRLRSARWLDPTSRQRPVGDVDP
jgi:hypothetical protein